MKRFIIFLMIAGVAANVSFAQEREMKIHHFLTVDPKADQYPGVNPYLYCAGNPIMYVDPTGERVGIVSVTGDAGAGMGAAASATGKVLIAFDDYGVTVAAEHSCRYVCNQNLPDGSNNPSILVGAVLGGTGDITYNWSAKSFYDQNTSTNFGSRGVDKYAKSFLELCLQKAGLLTKRLSKGIMVGVSGGTDEVSFSLGIGIDATVKACDRNPMQIDFAISLSYEESQGNFGIWTVTKQKLCRDGKGNHYFTGSLKVNGKKTNIQLRSDAVRKNGKWVSNNIWKSNKYMELEK